MQCRKSLLFFGNETRKKESSESCFDVTMGSFDGAKICENFYQNFHQNFQSHQNFQRHWF